MSRFRDFLSDALLVLGVGTVVLSIVQPFLIFSVVTPGIFDRWGNLRPTPFQQADYFAFKVMYDPGGIYSRSEFWNAYWFNNGGWLYIGGGPSVRACFLIAAFAIQILTLVLGIATFSLKPRMRIVPLVLCLSIMFLLTSVFFLHTVESFRWFVYSWSLGDGYWLSCASVLCLFVSIILARGRESKIMFNG
jgi:hypothetical protein